MLGIPIKVFFLQQDHEILAKKLIVYIMRFNERICYYD